MYRRVVTVVLLPCLLLTQSAAVQHFHANQPTDHDPRPHLHTNVAAAPHSHHHGDGGHHHHHDGDDEPETEAAPDPVTSPDHDDDAVYLAVDITTELGHTTEDTLRVYSWQLLPLNLLSGVVVGCPDRSPPRPHPSPHSVASDCPLYVRHLTLLI